MSKKAQLKFDKELYKNKMKEKDMYKYTKI